MSTVEQAQATELVSPDGTRVVVYRWDPVGAPRGVVQIAHGLGEHALRYARTAAELNAVGFVVYANDHRGHGATAGDPSRFGAFGEDGWNRLVGDIGALVEMVRDAHPGLPVVLLGHSMGSLATQQYLLDHSDRIDAAVLSGTTALDQLAAAIDLDQPLDLAGFNAAFEPARTESDWLSRDEAVVDAYVADPACGFGTDIPSSKLMFGSGAQLADPHRLAGIRKDLPLYVVAGDQDPINAGLALLNLLVERYRAAELTEVTVATYVGGRHEILNETNRAEVVADLVAWLDQMLATR